jgi:predicted dithiol-disulfide oxidoreductase (DUF899 family)
MAKRKPTAKPVKKQSQARSAKAKARKPAAARKIAPANKLTAKARVEALEKKILKEKRQLTDLRRSLSPEAASDYALRTHDGSEIRLSEMFGAHSDLILVHNMGKGCPYCTLWADGFTGLVKHLENRVGFVVVSKDEVATQREFYESRGWNFRMYSSHGTSFNRDMRFETESGKQQPGVSAFHKDADGRIFRTGYTYFGPGDDFCAIWPMLDLLKSGPAGWEPKFTY